MVYRDDRVAGKHLAADSATTLTATTYSYWTCLAEADPWHMKVAGFTYATRLFSSTESCRIKEAL